MIFLSQARKESMALAFAELGKGKLVIPVAKLMGWTVLHQGFQTLLRKSL